MGVKQGEFKNFEREGRERKGKRDSKNVIIITLIVVNITIAK